MTNPTDDIAGNKAEVEDLDKDYDDVDVPSALARDTQDGPGEDPLEALPPSDFESFATDDVEKEVS